MFTIPVGDLLSSYTGDSKSFSFSGEIYDGFFEDIVFLSPLEFSLDIHALDSGVNVHFHELKTQVRHDNKKHDIYISDIEREYKKNLDNLDPDDIRPITHDSIDLGPVIREEIIMASHSL